MGDAAWVVLWALREQAQRQTWTSICGVATLSLPSGFRGPPLRQSLWGFAASLQAALTWEQANSSFMMYWSKIWRLLMARSSSESNFSYFLICGGRGEEQAMSLLGSWEGCRGHGWEHPFPGQPTQLCLSPPLPSRGRWHSTSPLTSNGAIHSS